MLILFIHAVCVVVTIVVILAVVVGVVVILISFPFFVATSVIAAIVTVAVVVIGIVVVLRCVSGVVVARMLLLCYVRCSHTIPVHELVIVICQLSDRY